MPIDPDLVAAFISGIGATAIIYVLVRGGLAHHRHRRAHKAQGRLPRILMAQTLEQGRVRTAMD